MALGLGVSSTLPDNNTPTSVGASASISVNGLRQSHNIWLIDGGEADDRGGAGGIASCLRRTRSPSSQCLTSNYPPDYGISSGATISLSLKSGTQKFHGELWEFNRNTDYNANNYSRTTHELATRTAPGPELQHLRCSTSAARCSFRGSTTRDSAEDVLLLE